MASSSVSGVVELWRYQGGGSQSDDYAYGVTAAADNSLYLASSQNDFSGSGREFAVVKLDSDGELKWDWQEGSEGDDEIYSAAAVVNGVVGCGAFNGTWNGVTSEGNDFAAVKLNSGGTVTWRFQEGTDEDENFNAAIETADGNVVVAGYTAGSWDITNDGRYDVAAAKLNVDDGEVIWRYQAGTSGAGFAYIFAAAARGDGSVVLGGTVVGSFAKVFAGGSDTSDFIAVAMDEDGNELWRWQDGPGTGSNIFLSIAAFDDNSVLLAGYTEGDWDGDNSGGRDFAVTKLSASGVVEWNWQSGTEFDDEFEGVAIGIDGTAVLSGYTYGSWAATQAGDDEDMDFVAMSMDADGNILWEYQAGTTADDDFNDVAVRPDGSIVLAGWTGGAWTTPDEFDIYADFVAVLLQPNTPTIFPTPAPSGPTSSVEPPYVEPTSSGESNEGTPMALIIGVSVGGVVVIAILIACYFCWWRRRLPPPVPPAPPADATPVAFGKKQKMTMAQPVNVDPGPSYSAPLPAYSGPLPAYPGPPPTYSGNA